MPKIKRINHIAILVEDIDQALSFWSNTLGLEPGHVEDIQDQKSLVAFLLLGECDVELVKPTSEDTGIARYLERRGPGIHHICFEVDDIEAILEQLRQQGIRLIDEKPLIGTGDKKIAFIHPESTHGVLIELYELAAQEPEVRWARTRALADHVLARSSSKAKAAWDYLRALRT